MRREYGLPGRTSAERSGKCTMLHWFRPGDLMVSDTNHSFDFLDQAGVLTLGRDYGGGLPGFLLRSNYKGYSYSQIVPHGKTTLLNWRRQPRLILARTHDDNEGPTKNRGVTAVFDNGLFSQTPFGPVDAARQAQLGRSRIGRDGNVRFDDGTQVDSKSIYNDNVRAWCESADADGGPCHPVHGS
ncbi:MAG: hypothetical protein OXN89_11935 [Bryobacterales bacterium]|nr:hypothetical protein [Bryobacterales bacterium]